MKKQPAIEWYLDPFPHAIVDNFLPSSTFDLLKQSLHDLSDIETKKKFSTPIERKTIFTNHNIGAPSLDLIELLGSNAVKKMFQSAFGPEINILSMGETENYSGLSPFHVTEKGGYLGSHVDHSSVNNHSQRHICNSIFYASDEWEDGWGGETLLFSKNGLRVMKKVAPHPNRLLLFIHTASSFHGVSPYEPTRSMPRKTFYHDYYCNEVDITKAMKELNKRLGCNLTHAHHDTIFIPFFPQGIRLNSWGNVFSKRHFSYAARYLVYLLNRTFGIDLKPILMAKLGAGQKS